MIIITDGSDDSDVASARREAKNYNISIFAIGIGISKLSFSVSILK